MSSAMEQKLREKHLKEYDNKPTWVQTIENLLIALEMYRIEEEKAINRLVDILKAYGIDTSYEEIKDADTKEISDKIKEMEES